LLLLLLLLLLPLLQEMGSHFGLATLTAKVQELEAALLTANNNAQAQGGRGLCVQWQLSGCGERGCVK
jgi:hypothetical protein